MTRCSAISSRIGMDFPGETSIPLRCEIGVPADPVHIFVKRLNSAVCPNVSGAHSVVSAWRRWTYEKKRMLPPAYL